MNQAENEIVYRCGKCKMCYYNYKQLVEHLYWRHGTESVCCGQCGLRRWHYAVHKCQILPIDESLLSTCDTTYCICGQGDNGSPMIACDYPTCKLEWYHFKCVGIVTPPSGNWYCPPCTKKKASEKTK